MFILAIGLIIWRRPDAVTYPQFWAEDGRYWFADAYNAGWNALLASNAGYLQTFPRLVALPASHFDLFRAALIFNLVAIVVQASPAAFAMSRRFAGLAPLHVRAALGLAYVLIPSSELNATLTNAQWHLAILAAMVVAAHPSRSLGWRAFDITVLALSGLTGPFAVLLMPGVLVLWWMSREDRRWHAWLVVVLAAPLIAQALTFFQAHRGSGAALGANPKEFVFILADRVVLPATFGEEGHALAYTQGRPFGWVAAIVVAVAALAIIGFALRRSPLQVRVFLLVCFGVTAASLGAPLAPLGGPPAWAVFANTGGGERYFFMSEVAWIVCLVIAIAAFPRPRPRRMMGAILAASFLSGPITSWSYPPYLDKSPASFEAQLRATKVGSTLTIPINPDWTMSLKRR